MTNYLNQTVIVHPPINLKLLCVSHFSAVFLHPRRAVLPWERAKKVFLLRGSQTKKKEKRKKHKIESFQTQAKGNCERRRSQKVLKTIKPSRSVWSFTLVFRLSYQFEVVKVIEHKAWCIVVTIATVITPAACPRTIVEVASVATIGLISQTWCVRILMFHHLSFLQQYQLRMDLMSSMSIRNCTRLQLAKNHRKCKWSPRKVFSEFSFHQI